MSIDLSLTQMDQNSAVEQYDQLSDAAMAQLAEQALKQYPAHYQGKLSLLCRSENATFKIETATHRYAMRLHRPGYHSKHQIQSELDWLNALRDTGIMVPEAIPTLQGEAVQTLQANDGTYRHVVLFHWIDGDMPTTDIDPASFEQLGEITAKLHHHSRQWQKPVGFDRIIWHYDTMVTDQSHWGRWQDAPHLNPADHEIIHTALRQVKVALDQYGQSPEKYGLIHADLRLTNLIIHHGETRVIDFDDCGMGWFVHDLAAAMSFNEHLPNAPKWVEHWLTGYERVGHFDQADLDILPAMIIQRRIQMLAWTGTHAETEMTQSLGSLWAKESVRLCQKFLAGDGLPLG